MGTSRVQTDCGLAFIKAMNNPQGPHPLACELLGTELARWMGLPTFEFAVLDLSGEDAAMVRFANGNFAVAGPAFITKAAGGYPWGGSSSELKHLVNVSDISRLVVFDTWVLNWDRYPPEDSGKTQNLSNVFLENVPDASDGSIRLIAMDHSHCLARGSALNPSIGYIDRIQADGVYGIFPGFRELIREEFVIEAIEKLSEVDQNMIRGVVNKIPREWDIDSETRDALVRLLVQRAVYVADTILPSIRKICWPNQLFDKS
ncbi:HipA family kinase [Bremerella alba]|nr:HipA family kinase [Bremerella alba]